MPAGAHPQATRPPLSISLHAAEQPGESVVSPALSTTDTPLGNGLRSPWPAVFIPISLSLSREVVDFFLQTKCYRKADYIKQGKANLPRPKQGQVTGICLGPRKLPVETPGLLLPERCTSRRPRPGGVVLAISSGSPGTQSTLYHAESPGSRHIVGPQ